jgi:hypothetical protein
LALLISKKGQILGMGNKNKNLAFFYSSILKNKIDFSIFQNWYKKKMLGFYFPSLIYDIFRRWAMSNFSDGKKSSIFATKKKVLLQNEVEFINFFSFWIGFDIKTKICIVPRLSLFHNTAKKKFVANFSQFENCKDLHSKFSWFFNQMSLMFGTPSDSTNRDYGIS